MRLAFFFFFSYKYFYYFFFFFLFFQSYIDCIAMMTTRKIDLIDRPDSRYEKLITLYSRIGHISSRQDHRLFEINYHRRRTVIIPQTTFTPRQEKLHGISPSQSARFSFFGSTANTFRNGNTYDFKELRFCFRSMRCFFGFFLLIYRPDLSNSLLVFFFLVEKNVKYCYIE